MHFYKLSKMEYKKLKEANEKFAFEQLKIDADKGHLFLSVSSCYDVRKWNWH